MKRLPLILILAALALAAVAIYKRKRSATAADAWKNSVLNPDYIARHGFLDIPAAPPPTIADYMDSDGYIDFERAFQDGLIFTL